jgi:hypothetical protein
MHELTRSTWGLTVRLAVVYIDGEHRRLVVAAGKRRLDFYGLRASRQACVDKEVARDEAELQGFTAWLGVSPIDGEKNGW